MGDNQILRANKTIKNWLQVCRNSTPCVLSGIGDKHLDELKRRLTEAREVDGNRTLLDIVESKEREEESIRLKVHNDDRVYEASCHRLSFDCKDCKLTIVNDETDFEELTKERLGKKYQKVLIASVTHELRNPLNIEMGMLDTLSELKLGETAESYVEIARKNLKLLTYLVNDIHDLSSSDPVALSRSRFDVRSCLRECAELLDPQLKQKNLRFLMKVRPSVPAEILSDEARYRRILLNLLTNAIKYTYSGEVRVSIKPGSGPGAVVTTVADTGIGISPEKQKKLFEFASQINEVEEKCANPQGIGLGLSMCKKLAIALGGDISLKSTEGAGSKFRFTVKDFGSSTIGTEEERQTNQICVSLRDEEATAASPQRRQQLQIAPTLTTSADLLPTTVRESPICKCNPVLVVDDGPMNILVVQSYLRALGLHGDEVNSALIMKVGAEWLGGCEEGEGKKREGVQLQRVQTGADGHQHASDERDRRR